MIAILLLAAPAAGATRAPALRTVWYHGVKIAVPASWPIYRLSIDPTICVRFNRHALYLGRPSSAQRCPAHTAGRTEAILVEPLSGGGGPTQQPAVGGQDDATAARFALPAHGVDVVATWSHQPGVVARALGRRPVAGVHHAHGSKARAPAARASAAVAGSAYTGLGFDACSAPSASQMSAWAASPFHAVGIYVGGENMACSQPNLTTSWVQTETAAGWHLVPTYVGLQAPQNSCGCAGIMPKHAKAEGAADAATAAADAQAIGLGPGNPIYVDMEAYTPTSQNSSAVLKFLSAWTVKLHSLGYLSGVYSSSLSGMSDLVAAQGTTVEEPDDIWIANWNGDQSTNDPSVPSADWANHQRLHQYRGGHYSSYGGVTLNIDSDYLDGATAGAPLPDGSFIQVQGQGAIYEIVGGAPLYVSSWSAVGGTQPYTVVSQQYFASLRPVPADGTFVTTSTGGIYRIAGGAPLYVSSWSVFGGTQSSLTIDQWDIDNITDPAAHLNSVPANGTFLTTTSGAIYRVAGGAPVAVSNWSVFGGIQPSVTIDQWDVDNLASPAAHLQAVPADGTVVEGLPSQKYWVFVTGLRKPATPDPAATQLDDVGLRSFALAPPPKCVVPKLTHMTLAHAKRALHRAHCGLGKIHRPRHAPHRTLKVIRQSPRPHVQRRARFAVNIRLG